MTSDDIPIVAKDFSIIDLVRDGVPEVVLRLAVMEDGNDEIGFVILRYENGQVWGYAIGHRSFLDLKADGSFGFSSGAADWGFGTITLSEDGYEIDRITYCESVQDSEHSEEFYFVDYERASEKKFQAAVDEHNDKENAAWYDLTSENVAAQLEVKG